MKVAVQDSDALCALKPLELAAYLRAKGWQQEAELAGKGSLWLLHGPTGAEFDVTLPANRELGDYVLRMAEVLRTLAEVEGRSQLEVLRDVQTSDDDVVRVRTSSRVAENGTLPLDQAVVFVERSRDMMLAAACSAIEKRRFYAKRKPQKAMEYLGHVRMGQTERGSYVLTILSPVPPELRPAQGTFLPVESGDPYERIVTRTLMDALKALEVAAQKAAVEGNITSFEKAVGRGVSANLCDAVVDLSKISPEGGLDIQVSWSPTRPVAGAISSRVILGSDSIPFVEEAARLFRESASRDDVEVEGVVTRLDRNPTATAGDVTITGNVDGQMRRITLTFGPDTYSQAIQAHVDRSTVRCTGELVKEGASYRLKDPRHFEILAAD